MTSYSSCARPATVLDMESFFNAYYDIISILYASKHSRQQSRFQLTMKTGLFFFCAITSCTCEVVLAHVAVGAFDLSRD